MKISDELGHQSINKLLLKQSIPASIGILVMSIYLIADTIFIGQWVGSMAIAAITVVMPVTFLISSFGMAIGIGGASIISRALGAGDQDLAAKTFGNQITLSVILIISAVIPGFIFDEEILVFFGAKGEILAHALDYFHVTLMGVPFLTFAMMSNNIIRAQGFPKTSMNTMLIPAVLNLVLDPIFIKVFDWGLEGAAWATTISYVVSAAYAVWFFIFGKNELRIKAIHLKPILAIIKEINLLGMVTLVRQGMTSILIIILNNVLFTYGGEIYIAVFGVINRIMMFALFPVMGITQGLLPIVGYNYGANQHKRVRETMKISIIYGTGLGTIIYIILIIFRENIISIFGSDSQLTELTSPALLIVFMAIPIIAIQLMGAAYFQAIGKAMPALLLTISRQGLIFIPLMLILPKFLGIDGIWYAFPISDVLSSIITVIVLRNGLKKLKMT
ncbi:MAG: MATE family efflux transporter [Bacteroidales bacterium]|nr:MATE family efflux transporter [Bacteroidales bacterium]